jgi:hypothetical protein
VSIVAIGLQYEQGYFRVRTLLAKRFYDCALENAFALDREFVDVARSRSPHAQLSADEGSNAPTLLLFA